MKDERTFGPALPAALLLCSAALLSGCEAQGRCSRSDVSVEFSAPDVYPGEDACEADPFGVQATECVVSSIEAGAAIAISLQCEDPELADTTLSIELDPSGELDLDVGAPVTLELRKCVAGVRIADARGLVLAAIKSSHNREDAASFTAQIDASIRPLVAEVRSQACLRRRTWSNDEVTISDGDDALTLYAGNAGFLGSAPRWLVVVDALGTMTTDVVLGSIDLAILRVR